MRSKKILFIFFLTSLLVMSVLGYLYRNQIGDFILDHFFHLDLGGESYVGKGPLNLEIQLESGQKFHWTEKDLEWDSIRLSPGSTDSPKQTLRIFRLRLSDKKNYLNLNCNLDNISKPGNYSSWLFFGPQLSYTIDPRKEHRFYSGTVTIEKIDLSLNGQIKGSFSFGRKQHWARGEFDLQLSAAPSIFPVWH